MASFLYARVASGPLTSESCSEWHSIGQRHSSLGEKGNVGSLKHLVFNFCSKAEVPGNEGRGRGRRASGGGAAQGLDLLSPEGHGPS